MHSRGSQVCVDFASQRADVTRGCLLCCPIRTWVVLCAVELGVSFCGIVVLLSIFGFLVSLSLYVDASQIFLLVLLFCSFFWITVLLPFAFGLAWVCW
jgi:hypothetical protein